MTPQNYIGWLGLMNAVDQLFYTSENIKHDAAYCDDPAFRLEIFVEYRQSINESIFYILNGIAAGNMFGAPGQTKNPHVPFEWHADILDRLERLYYEHIHKIDDPLCKLIRNLYLEIEEDEAQVRKPCGV